MIDHTKWLGGCMIAAGLLALPALAQQTHRLPADTQYPSQYKDVDRYTNRSGAASPFRYESDYGTRARTYRTGDGAGQQSVSGTQQWYQRDEPVPMQYRTREYQTYDAGVYRDADRDGDQSDQGYRFRSSAGTQSTAGTQRWYGEREEDHAYHYDAATERERMIRRQQARQSPYDYNVYGTERETQRWLREDRAEYNPQYDRRYDSRYETRSEYERQRAMPERRDADVNVYYRERDRDQPVPFNYESRTTTPQDRWYDDVYGMERQDGDLDVNYRTDETRPYVDLDRRSSDEPVQPSQFEFRTDAGWYYDEDRRVWVRVPGHDHSQQSGRIMQEDRER